MAKVLIIEDDETLSSALSQWLESENHRVESTTNGGDGLQLLTCSGFDLALVDWQLPEMSGPDLIKQYRKRGGKIPILMLTEKSQVLDKAEGLGSGADDYLPKPFDLIELSARVKALLRRSSGFFDQSLQSQQISLNYGRCELVIEGKRIQVVPREFEVLEFLLRHSGCYINSEKLISHVWDSEAGVTAEALRVCIMRIRKKLEASGAPQIIESSKGSGYRIPATYSLSQTSQAHD